jgi:KaiC/GvpD/RAD55 family RecA-like ATPase
LVTGPFGNGKSLLSLQMAVEVARKGGVAWVMALEQTAEECLYSLEAIGVTTEHPGMRVHRGVIDSLLAFTMPAQSQGALVFLRPEPGEDRGFGKFLEKVHGQLGWMSRYPLRLLVIDPVNALGEPSQERDRQLRRKTRTRFEAAKLLNVNVWFTSEQVMNQPAPDHFEENVADTVIHLGVDERSGYKSRYIEITKSRFQQEFPGRHTLVIEPQTGLRIYPSSAIISRTLRMDSPSTVDGTIQFGVTGMDQIFGPESVTPGDLVVFTGPGKAKTLLGMQFLTADLENRRYRSLVVENRSHHPIARKPARYGLGDRPSGVPSFGDAVS